MKVAAILLYVDVSWYQVEVKPTKLYSRDLEDVGEEWSGDEDDVVEEVIIPGTDWESVNYVYKKFGCEVLE